jgi:ribosomal protein S18 acetylase RimI-like enzyme
MNISIITLNNPSADVSYTDAIMSLLNRAQDAKAVPYLYPNNRDFFERNLMGDTINILALDKEKVIGYAALRKMTPWPDYLEPTELNPEECALMLLNLVDPEYRGLGIGKNLLKARIESAKQAGFFHLYATVHPDNTASVHVLTGLGFEIIAQKPMFSNQLMRNLMYLNLCSHNLA